MCQDAGCLKHWYAVKYTKHLDPSEHKAGIPTTSLEVEKQKHTPNTVVLLNSTSISLLSRLTSWQNVHRPTTHAPVSAYC